MTDPAMPPDLDRLLGAATVPAMSADLIDRIVAEAQRPGRAAMPVATPRRANARAWTRRGVRSGIVAVGLMLATAVAAAFGGGALSVAKIRAVAQHVVERIRHPFHHAVPAAAPAARIVHRMAVPATAIRVAPDRFPAGAAPHAFVAPLPVRSGPMPGRTFAHVPPRMGPLRPVVAARPYRAAHVRARFAAARPFAHRPAERPARFAHPQQREPQREPRIEPRVPDSVPIEPHVAPAPIAPMAATPAQNRRSDGLQGDGGRRFDGPRWRDPSRFGAGQGLRVPGWRARMQGGGGANAPGWRRRAGAGGGMRPKPFRPGGGGGRRPRRF